VRREEDEGILNPYGQILPYPPLPLFHLR